MDKADLYDEMPVIVFVHYGRDWSRYAGKVTGIGRKYVTIEWALTHGGHGSDRFDIESQKVPSRYSYATHFRTPDQVALDDRKMAADLNLRAIGLDYSRHAAAGPKPSLDEIEAVVDLIARMRSASDSH